MAWEIIPVQLADIVNEPSHIYIPRSFRYILMKFLAILPQLFYDSISSDTAYFLRHSCWVNLGIFNRDCFSSLFYSLLFLRHYCTVFFALSYTRFPRDTPTLAAGLAQPCSAVLGLDASGTGCVWHPCIPLLTKPGYQYPVQHHIHTYFL